VVEAGDQLVVVADEKVAREMTKVKTVHRVPIGIGEVSQAIKEGELTELKLIIKVDVQGSLEAIVDSLNSLQSEEVKINFIHQGVGPISESDVNLASVSGALLIAYRVPIPLPVRKLAQTLELKISSYDIIYRLLEDITAALSGLLKPEIIEERLGAMKVLGVFRTTKDEKIVGGEVQDGKIVHGNTVKILRDGAEIGQGKIKSLQQEKVAVDEVTAGHQCGLDIETTIKIKEGDILECFKIEERMRTVERA
jgi:translation initiation factor IF-2